MARAADTHILYDDELCTQPLRTYDFGDSLGGIPKSLAFWVRNPTEARLQVQLTAKHADVSFSPSLFILNPREKRRVDATWTPSRDPATRALIEADLEGEVSIGVRVL